jgi:hypothetical protein
VFSGTFRTNEHGSNDSSWRFPRRVGHGRHRFGGTDRHHYSFAAAADVLGVATGGPILLGAFVHFNEVIPVPNLSGVDLNFEFDTNGVPALVSAIFPFVHNETPNNTGTSPADDDIVTITTPLVNIPITVAPTLTTSTCWGSRPMAASPSTASSSHRKGCPTRRRCTAS